MPVPSVASVTSRPVDILLRRGCWTLLFALLALGCTSERDADAKPVAKKPAPVASTPVPTRHAVESTARPVASSSEPRCREQPAQDFLLRPGQIAQPHASAEVRRQILAARKRSIEYRTREYGHFPGFGSSAENPHPPRYYAERITFMGLPVVLNRKIVPAVRCVEAALKTECAARPYQPQRLSGIRFSNTYQDYEVSNHVYGIAIDVDPDRNPCCHCVGKWSKKKICDKKVASPFERMAMPGCWVKVFERYGFHWLGHDELEDTMHFEFLGDPDRILE